MAGLREEAVVRPPSFFARNRGRRPPGLPLVSPLVRETNGMARPPPGRARLPRLPAENRGEWLNHKAPRTSRGAPSRGRARSSVARIDEGRSDDRPAPPAVIPTNPRPGPPSPLWGGGWGSCAPPIAHPLPQGAGVGSATANEAPDAIASAISVRSVSARSGDWRPAPKDHPLQPRGGIRQSRWRPSGRAESPSHPA
jgi:hypothetical protein